ncbi:hypothetical protein [Methylobacterium pseudosasicola]|uniref:Uncharacterized protein n=1 Tax=Methylobacterium pseudosasicola TaxID=582667 RepID=A0A1I4GN12_9HYPH|nr:hypothetical protein [Methylobacterium pseudosasicola]SFL30777.1 hypothetical protein SAMN05192568_100384 [Methylobacterium pseudosasicola]
MTTTLRHPRSDDHYVSDRVFDGIRTRDADTSARDRERAVKQLDRLRAGRRADGDKRA